MMMISIITMVLLYLNSINKYHSYYCSDDDDNHDRLNAGFGRSQGKFGGEDLKRIDLSQTIPQAAPTAAAEQSCL